MGELEEQLKKIEEENEEEEERLKDEIENLSRKLEECRKDMVYWKKRCDGLEGEVLTEERAKEAAVKELHEIKAGNQLQTEAVPGGCSNCSSTRCQCIDDAFDLSSVPRPTDDSSLPKRPTSPQQGVSSKRQRSAPEIKTEPEELEIDFTSRFSVRRPSRNGGDAASPIVLFDPCGFCQDGTPCICAEMAVDRSKDRDKPPETNKLPPIQNLSQFTPPPSEGDVLSDPLPSVSSRLNPCANGPGTCAQCLADPKRTLFCKSLAASRSASAASGPEEGCCGGRGSSGGCCRSQKPPRSDNRPGQSGLSSTSSPPITLSCSDAFTTLSRHPNFSRASDELNTWLPQLHTLPNPRDLPANSFNSRPAMEVEAASVMGVLRYFDRRFATE